MGEKMRTQNEKMYRSFRRAQREGHTAVVQVATRDLPPGLADWWSDLRRGRLNVYGGTLRLIDTLHTAHRSDLAVLVAEALLEYAKETAQHDPNGQAA